MSIIEQMLLKYEIKTQNDIINAIKEIINIKYLLIGVVVCQYSFLNENLKKK